MEEQQLVDKIINFLKKNNPTIDKGEKETIIEINNDKSNQTIIIQIPFDDSIWVRLKEPYSAYYYESFDEFKNYFQQLIDHKIEIAIGYQNGNWKETTIINTNQDANLNANYQYTIASWKK